jgi:ribonuclease D
LAQDCAQLLAKFGQQESYYLKVKSAWKLQPKQLYLLDQLTQWREQTARDKDVPRGRILKDRSCFEVAANFPASLGALADVEEVGPGTIRRYGEAILALVSKAKEASPSDYPKRLDKPLPKESGASLKTLKRVADRCAQQLNIPVEVLVKKRDYEALLRSGLSTGQYRLPQSLCGWREQVVGKALLESLRSQS